MQPGADKVPVVFFSNPADHGLRARLLDERAADIIKDAAPGTRLTLRCFVEGLTPRAGRPAEELHQALTSSIAPFCFDLVATLC